MSAASTAAVKRVVLTNVVGRLKVSQTTTDAGTKPEPTISSVVAGAPSGALVGDIDVRTGSGLTAALMVIEKAACTAFAEESRTVTKNAPLPAIVGTPD